MTREEFFAAWFYGGPTPHFGHVRKGSPSPKPSKGGEAKKGRNKVKCTRYKTEGRREINARRRLRRHIKRHPGDAAAIAYLSRV